MGLHEVPLHEIPSRAQRAAARGFSLIELLVVVIIIGIFAVLAVPAMSLARLDRIAYDDAASVAALLRTARTRSLARGGAVLVAMNGNGSTDRGSFTMWDAVQVNAGQGGGIARMPVSSCKAPTIWNPLQTTNLGVYLVDGYDMNGPIEGDADIRATMWLYKDNQTFNATQQSATAYLCYTPLGRSYLLTGALAVNAFDPLLPSTSPFEIRVTRANAATTRSVMIPPNGMARLFSHL
jgi:prepilin-type N-terminal cleavage/methylation domain-containing protein